MAERDVDSRERFRPGVLLLWLLLRGLSARWYNSPRLMTSGSTTGEAATGSPSLVRTLGLFTLVAYGVGDMVGSGIYGTVGKAAGQMGNAVWLSFVVSMAAAILTGLSYASLASRYPRAAGAAFITQHAFGWAFLSYVVGLIVTVSGLTSMATSSNVFSATLGNLLGVTGSLGRVEWQAGAIQVVSGDVAVWLLMLAFLLVVSFVNFWGIRESMWANLVCTAVEVTGLLVIVAIGVRYWGNVPYLETPRAVFDPASGAMLSSGLELRALFSASVLTFFAFVGFEDMLNVSEEVKNPERTMPLGIVLSLVVASVLYVGVAITAVSVVDYRELAAAPAPLSVISRAAAGWLPPWTYDWVTLFAVANTVLINYVMASRLLYGMARQGLVPRRLGRIHPARRTPHVAIATLLCAVLLLALSGGIADLAAATGLLLLTSFAVVNVALIVLKFRKGEKKGGFEIPFVVPLLAALVNGVLIAARLSDPSPQMQRAVAIAGVLVVLVGGLYFVMRPRALNQRTLAELERDGD